MDKYLVEILKAFNTIIIPGLGALNLTNPTTGECLFMPYLKYDDGKLSQYISETEGMSDNDAKNLIAKYVREIEAKLNSGESYDMYHFGSFIKNSSGDIEFNSWKNETNKENSTSEKTVEIEESPTETVIIEAAVITEIVPEELTTDSIPEEVEKIEEQQINAESNTDSAIETVEVIVDKNNNSEQEDKIPVEEPTVLENSSVTEYTIEPETSNYSEADQWADDLDVPPLNAKIERPKKPIIEKVKKDKKRRKPVFYLLLVVGVLLVGGTLTYGLFYNSLEKFLPFMAKETTVQEKNNSSSNNSEIEKSTPEEDSKMTEEESLNQEKQIEPEKNVEPIVEQVNPEPAVTNSNSYHIIGGAFIEKSNADRYQNRLVSEGNQSTIIGQFDNLYIVSIASYSSLEEANNELLKARSISSRAWVFKWPYTD
jgi:nucleoid DNA-binding protein